MGPGSSEAQLLELEITPSKTRMLHQSEICVHALQVIHPILLQGSDLYVIWYCCLLQLERREHGYLDLDHCILSDAF